MRARAVDLAGNGPTITEADALLGAFDAAGVPQPVLPQRRPFEFRRFDPLAAPAVVPRRTDTEGESVEHAVLRSDHDVSAPDYAADTGYAATTERHVAPAKAALQDAELLGCFDAAIGSGDPGAVQAAYTVALRESGRLGEVGGGEVVRPEEQLELPYLPDPWSVGTALVGLPGLAAGTVTRVQPDGTMASEPDQLPGQPPQPGRPAGRLGHAAVVVAGPAVPAAGRGGIRRPPGTPRPGCSPWRCRRRPGWTCRSAPCRTSSTWTSTEPGAPCSTSPRRRTCPRCGSSPGPGGFGRSARPARFGSCTPCSTRCTCPTCSSSARPACRRRPPRSWPARSGSTPPAPTGWTSRRAGRNGPTSGALAATTRRPGGSARRSR